MMVVCICKPYEMQLHPRLMANMLETTWHVHEAKRRLARLEWIVSGNEL